MSNSEELARQEQRRRQNTERLNQKEEMLVGRECPTRRAQMSEEELETEIERNDWLWTPF